MSKIVIYAFPAVIDMVMASAMFVCTVRAAEMGESASRVANLVTTLSIGYMVVCILVGRIVTPRNASKMLVAACAAIAGVSLAFVLFPGFSMMYPIVLLLAFALGFFFVPFQVFMKQVSHGGSGGITRSVGLYTLSWSSGFALGPLVSGWLWKAYGWQTCCFVNIAAAIMSGVAIALLSRLAAAPHRGAAGPPAGRRPEPDYTSMPDLAWIAWLCGGIGCITFALLRGVLPSSGVAFHLTKPEQGNVFFIFAGMQALVGLALAWSRTWMYRAAPLAVFGLFGAAGLVLFSLARTPAAFYGAAACYGVYSGSLFFYLVFHALVHPVHSARYVSINESVVGVTGIIGPAVGGLLADHWGLSASYLAAAILVGAALVMQVVVHTRHAAAVAGLERSMTNP